MNIGANFKEKSLSVKGLSNARMVQLSQGSGTEINLSEELRFNIILGMFIMVRWRSFRNTEKVIYFLSLETST